MAEFKKIKLANLVKKIEKLMAKFPSENATEIHGQDCIKDWCKSGLTCLQEIIDDLTKAYEQGSFDKHAILKHDIRKLINGEYRVPDSLPRAKILISQLFTHPEDPEITKKVHTLLFELARLINSLRWEPAIICVIEKLYLMQKELAQFLTKHSEWEKLSLSWENYPPKICLIVVHKPVEDQRRAEHIDARGVRLAYPKDEELEPMSTFIAQFAEKCSLKVYRERSSSSNYPKEQSVFRYIFKPDYQTLVIE